MPVICTGGFQTASVIAEGDRARRLRRGQRGAAAGRQQRSGPRCSQRGRTSADKPCTYCNRCLVNVVENPLGCYDETRFPSREAMVAQIMSVFDPPPFVDQPVGVSREAAMSGAWRKKTIAADEAADHRRVHRVPAGGQRAARAGARAPIGRFNQARATACVDAEFTVPDDLPADAAGRAVRARRAPIRRAIRFANATSSPTASATSAACRSRCTGVPGREPDARRRRSGLRAEQPSR